MKKKYVNVPLRLHQDCKYCKILQGLHQDYKELHQDYEDLLQDCTKTTLTFH